MRVGLFIDTFYPMVDGVINVVDNYAKNLAEFCDVTVFCPIVNKKIITDKPYKIIQCKSIPLKITEYSLPTPRFDRNFYRRLNESNLDLVHIHSPFTVGEAGKSYAKKHGVPLVATLHSQYRQDFEKSIKLKTPTNFAMNLIMKTFNSCDECWAVNEGIKKLYEEEYGLLSPCKIRLNATDHTPLTDLETDFSDFDRCLGIEKGASVYLFVGRINYLKNIFLIVDSLAILKKKGKKFKMLFVGKGADEDRLKERVKQLNLTEDVIFLGRITDKFSLERLYKRATLFLFPSSYDANSLVQIESACQKTPTVFLRGAKTATGIIDGENGYLAENDPTAFAEKILQIESDPTLYLKVCEGAHKTLYRSWQTEIKSVYREYLRLCRKKFER